MMTDTMRLSLLFICVLIFGRDGLGSAFPTVMTSNEVRAVAPLSVNMTCIPEKPIGPREKVLIEARLQDDNLANVRLRYRPEAPRTETGTDAGTAGTGTEFLVEGHVNNEHQHTHSFLTLRVLNPKPQDAGRYQCAVYNHLGRDTGAARQRRDVEWGVYFKVTWRF